MGSLGSAMWFGRAGSESMTNASIKSPITLMGDFMNALVVVVGIGTVVVAAVVIVLGLVGIVGEFGPVEVVIVLGILRGCDAGTPVGTTVGFC